MATVYIGMGSNLGDRRANCEEALSRISGMDGVTLIRTSELYETQPVGGPPQGRYINGAAEIRTEMPPEELIVMLKSIERDMGREESPLKDHPRIMDLDIIFYDDSLIDTPSLKVPHPEMHKRYFVLKGLAEIAPGKVHPALGRTVLELYNEVKRNVPGPDR
jgi:2-amino-4-hydroxy-6-hydroxymethyldihydropteridine diphosphokinase